MQLHNWLYQSHWNWTAVPVCWWSPAVPSPASRSIGWPLWLEIMASPMWQAMSISHLAVGEETLIRRSKGVDQGPRFYRAAWEEELVYLIEQHEWRCLSSKMWLLAAIPSSPRAPSGFRTLPKPPPSFLCNFPSAAPSTESRTKPTRAERATTALPPPFRLLFLLSSGRQQ